MRADLALAATLIANLLIPVFLAVWVAVSRAHTRLEAALVALVAGTCILYLSRAGTVWSWVGNEWPYVFAALYVAALVVLILRVRQAPWWPSGRPGAWTQIAVLAFVVLIFGIQNVAVARARSVSGPGVELTFPLRGGRFEIVQGGNSRLLNHHYGEPGQRFALDIVALGPRGFRAHGLRPAALDQYQVFDMPVFAPCAGQVIDLHDGIPDSLQPEDNPERLAGNYVTLFCDGHTILLAHLKEGTVAVTRGAHVADGQIVGHAGSSGNASEPHLHIQADEGLVTDHQTLITTAVGVPMRFHHRFLVRNEIVRN